MTTMVLMSPRRTRVTSSGVATLRGAVAKFADMQLQRAAAMQAPQRNAKNARKDEVFFMRASIRRGAPPARPHRSGLARIYVLGMRLLRIATARSPSTRRDRRIAN